MDLQAKYQDNVLVLAVEGRIDGTNAGELESATNSAIKEDDKAVVLNLQELTYISSAGLRSILITAKNLSARQAKFALSNIPANIMEIIKIAGFDKIISVYEDLNSAISAVK